MVTQLLVLSPLGRFIHLPSLHSLDPTFFQRGAHSNPPFCRQGAALTHLDSPNSQSHDLNCWLCPFSFWQKWLQHTY